MLEAGLYKEIKGIFLGQLNSLSNNIAEVVRCQIVGNQIPKGEKLVHDNSNLLGLVNIR